MKFAVRYWSSLLPDHRLPNGEPHWVEYSQHPATKLGLHNALLTLQDRREILARHGGIYECAVYIQDDEEHEKLDQATAERLFVSLPHGEVKWSEIRDFLLPPLIGMEVFVHTDASSQQLPLFEHPHTPYDEVVLEHHDFETDA